MTPDVPVGAREFFVLVGGGANMLIGWKVGGGADASSVFCTPVSNVLLTILKCLFPASCRPRPIFGSTNYPGLLPDTGW